VPIHEIRAEVCYRLKIADLLFNKALTDLADGEHIGRYYVNLDPGGAGTLPPSVIPFTWRDRSYYLMTIITKDQ